VTKTKWIAKIDAKNSTLFVQNTPESSSKRFIR
jgi:hypothetical protein